MLSFVCGGVRRHPKLGSALLTLMSSAALMPAIVEPASAQQSCVTTSLGVVCTPSNPSTSSLSVIYEIFGAYYNIEIKICYLFISKDYCHNSNHFILISSTLTN